MKVRCDLHIHSCLSPCGDLEMSPNAIAQEAKKRGLDVIALTDHNTALNTPAFMTACNKAGIFGIYGIEITSSEEAHVLALFKKPETAVEMGKLVYKSLLSGKNDPEKWGDQVYLDDDENIIGEVEKYLTGGASIYSISELLEMTLKRDGIFIPAHIDKPQFSIKSQLGFLPDEEYSAIGLTKLPPIMELKGKPFITNSDAHYLHNIGDRSFTLDIEDLSFSHIKEAIVRGKITIN
ncbi:PHP domain-containing protein [Thiospirochaeta perfilievii]|uniref:PHP domain-containing protein n=1 Tax=Thiospirochaeta perfilievii TaxID=252967 RepID=A0A5C1QBR8_9SPIO|nr:PHP domain-containing protein [Thiospirochaeta perfilievii]QEN04176.1 PHP domain-containing protein [Thiospirochaeta perfilievii]